MKKIKLFASALAALLLVASIGYAANMQVTSSASPVSGGTITPSGIKFYAGDATYIIAPKAGWTLASILIDGMPASGAQVIDSTHYTVLFNTSKIHTISANFSQVLYSITTTTGANGTMTVTGGGSTNIAPGSSRQVVVAPSTGYKILTLTVDGNPVTLADPTIAYTVSYTNIQANKSVSATFGIIPSATVNPGANKTVGANPGGTAFSTNLTGSVTSNPAYSALLWQVVSGPTGGSFTNGATLTPTFTGTTLGTYYVALRATVGGVNFTSPQAAITVVAAGVADAGSNSCIACHAGSIPVTQYSASGHAKFDSPTCSGCHSGSTHPGTTVTSATCENCHTATLSTTTHPVAITASKCTMCHDPHNPAAGIADLSPAPAHPAVTLYTFEEVGMQMAGGQKVPVQVDANGKGMPYSPKQTCGTSGCHIKNGVDYTYDKISDHAFHSAQGRNEMVDSATGKFDATKNKPWLQATAMVGKW